MKRLIAAFLIVLAAPLWAVEPDEVLADPVLEERARAISANVRCVVCQNEPIDSSNAGVARDLRILIRERLTAGDSDQEVYDFLVARYGDYVLFKPPFKPSTYALWLAPFVILGVGGGAALWVLARRPRRVRAEDQSLSAEEEQALTKLLNDDKDRDPT
ncbi:MAG: cytochrome c-type biogenesis protein CcmH [Litoreibacter sp.]|nr:cytochrome c-type biogenesis protein CcmH [Litoreibacter sp.]